MTIIRKPEVGQTIRLTDARANPIRVVTAVGEKLFLAVTADLVRTEYTHNLSVPWEPYDLEDEFPIGAIYVSNWGLRERSWIVDGHDRGSVLMRFFNAASRSTYDPRWEPERIRTELREVYRP